VTTHWIKNSIILSKLAQIFFQHSKNKTIYNFVKFVATKKDMTTNFLELFLDPGWVKFRIRDKHRRSATLVSVHLPASFKVNAHGTSSTILIWDPGSSYQDSGSNPESSESLVKFFEVKN
jgi:hypothetical protein